MSRSELAWWLRHGQEIVNTMAAPYAADVIGLLHDNTSYGVAGDHGGAQEPVQRIPIVFAGTGVGSRDSQVPMRSVDILPTVLRQLGIRADSGVEGRACHCHDGERRRRRPAAYGCRSARVGRRRRTGWLATTRSRAANS
jgi:arylsulfatase A-like enzyme